MLCFRGIFFQYEVTLTQKRKSSSVSHPHSTTDVTRLRCVMSLSPPGLLERPVLWFFLCYFSKFLLSHLINLISGVLYLLFFSLVFFLEESLSGFCLLRCCCFVFLSNVVDEGRDWLNRTPGSTVIPVGWMTAEIVVPRSVIIGNFLFNTSLWSENKLTTWYIRQFCNLINHTSQRTASKPTQTSHNTSQVQSTIQNPPQSSYCRIHKFLLNTPPSLSIFMITHYSF